MDLGSQVLEVARNYDAFQRCLASYLATHRGHYALMHDAAVVAFYPRAGEAYQQGTDRFPDGQFSIQEVTDEPIDLGFFSHAGA